MRTHRYVWALAVALLASCYDYGAPDEVLYGEAVYSQPSPSANFAALDTYYIDPTFRLAEADEITNQPLPANVQTAIRTNMDRLGYTEVGSLPAAGTAGAVGIKVAVLKGSAAYYYSGYWCDYWYYYSCYYDWYYAGSYDFGTVILEMGDLSAPAGGTLPVLWMSAIYGVATSAVYDTQRIIDGVNRAFGQSPYLDTH